MKIKLSVLKECVSVVLESGETAALQKYKFLKPDTLELIKQVIWKYSADIAAEKAAKNKQFDPQATKVDQNVGEVKPTKEQVYAVAEDAAMAISNAIDDLTKHFIGMQTKAAPPRRSDTGSHKPISSNTGSIPQKK
jgi:hypothetical protein